MEISVGYVNVDQSLSIDGKDSGVDPVRAIVAGVVAPGTVAGIPFAFGFGLHLPDDRLSRVRALPQDQPRWELYDNRNQLLYLAANLAISPWPWLQIGGGASFLSSTTATLDISGQANIYTSDSSQLRSSVAADLTAVRYPQAGVRVALGDKLAFAVVYRGQFSLDLDLKASIRGNISGLTTAVYDLQTDSVNNFLPQQLVVGGSWKIGPSLRADLDLTWVNWSAYVPPVSDVSVVLNIPPPKGGWPANITPPTTPAPHDRRADPDARPRRSARRVRGGARLARRSGRRSSAPATSTTRRRSCRRRERRTTSIAIDTPSRSASGSARWI